RPEPRSLTPPGRRRSLSLVAMLPRPAGAVGDGSLGPPRPLSSGRVMEPNISSLIASAEGGDHSAADALFTALYSELHRLARRQLSRNAGGLTLGTTTLLHEAYLQVA